MARSAFAANAFMKNFAAGFSFVDDIQRNKRAEARLEERLKEQKLERAFERDRTNERDEQVREDRQIQQDERDRIADVRLSFERGEKAAFDPSSSNETLRADILHSPSARAELTRRIGKDRVNAALQEVRSIPVQGQSARLSDVATENPIDSAPVDDPAPVAANQDLFQRSRGTNRLTEISEEDAELFGEEFQDKGFASQLLSRAVGSGQQVTRAIGEIGDFAAGVQSKGLGVGPGSESTVGSAISGSTFVSNDFIPPEQIQTWPANRPATPRVSATQRSSRRTSDLARSPSRNKLARPLSLQGAVQEGGSIRRDHALREERRVFNKYSAFLEGNGDSQLEQMALNDPSAAAVDYFGNRETLKSAHPDMIAEVDRRMVPVLDSYMGAVQANLDSLPQGAEYNKAQKQLDQIRASRNVIAVEAPSPSEAAGVTGGLKIGDTERVQSVLAAMSDPNAPSRSSVTMPQLNAALTTAGRITPNRRLNDAQTKALATIKEAGYLTGAVALQVMMTGAWPAGVDPNGIKKITEAGDTVYAITNAGGLMILPSKDERDLDKVPSNELTDENIGFMLAGARTKNLDEARLNQAEGWMRDNAKYIRQHYSVNSSEQMGALGRSIGQAIFFSGKETKRMTDDSFFRFSNPKNAPTMDDIMFSPAMREKLAEEYRERPISMPSVTRTSGFDFTEMRRDIADGQFGVNLISEAETLEEPELLYIFWAKHATPEEIAAANAAAN